MKMKPQLDVENIADFKQYYEGAYVRLRDTGEVVYIELVRAASGQVAYAEAFTGGGDANHRLHIIEWDQVARTFIFGKVPTGMVDIKGKLVWIYQRNNRTPRRGYHPDEYHQCSITGTYCLLPNRGVDLGWERRQWHDLAAHCIYNPEYSTLASIDRADQQRGYALNHMYGIAAHGELTKQGKTIKFGIFRRDKRIGEYLPDRRLALLYPDGIKMYGPSFSFLTGAQVDVYRE